MTPTAPASPQPTHLPTGVTPGPPTMPAPHQPPGRYMPTPATRPPITPTATARQLCQHLHEHGQTGLYTAAFRDIAVVSLPHLTIWIHTHTLTWTHDGQPTTWPAHDTHGAARHLTQLTRPTMPQTTPPPGPSPP